MSTSRGPEPEPLARLLRRAHHWFRAAMAASLEAEVPGVTPAHASVLGLLDPAAGVPLSGLARQLGVSVPGVHQMVHRLVALGLVEVVPDPGSRRSKLAVLTPEGVVARRRAVALLAVVEAGLAQRIGAERVAVLREILEQDWGECAGPVPE